MQWIRLEFDYLEYGKAELLASTCKRLLLSSLPIERFMKAPFLCQIPIALLKLFAHYFYLLILLFFLSQDHGSIHSSTAKQNENNQGVFDATTSRIYFLSWHLLINYNDGSFDD